MAYKIIGTLSEAGQVLIFDETDWSLEASEAKSAGSYEITGVNGNKKTVVARSAGSGAVAGYGNITPIEY
jgi:hypothetical protein